MPATSWRISVPRSTSRRSNLSAPFTRSAFFTWATRNSTLAKSSMLILPSGMAAGGLAGGLVSGFCAEAELPPLQLLQIELLDVAQAHLRPDFRGRVGNHGMRQGSDNAQGFGA